MKKIILICDTPLRKYDMRLGPAWQSWLYKYLPDDEVIRLHDASLNPFSIGVYQENERLIFEVNALNQHYGELFEKVLMNSAMSSIQFESWQDKKFNIQEKRIVTFNSQQLKNVFYSEKSISKFDIYIKTPIAFMQEGKYINLPNIELMFRNILSKYNYAFEDTLKVDNDLLNQIVTNTYIGKYDLYSRYFPIHKVYIPSFNGNFRILVKGNDTIKNYIEMLLRFAEFSGIGIKTSMGMGKIIVKGEEK